MCMEILPALISVHRMHAWCQRGEKRTMNVPELELQMFVSHNVAPGTQLWLGALRAP